MFAEVREDPIGKSAPLPALVVDGYVRRKQPDPVLRDNVVICRRTESLSVQRRCGGGSARNEWVSGQGYTDVRVKDRSSASSASRRSTA